jgi:predicted enzyme related to lactoylglutathione lyase
MSVASTAWTWQHSSLTVGDLDRAIAFYQAAFGYELLFRDHHAEKIARLAGLPGLRCDLAQLRSPISGHVLEFILFHDVLAGREDHAPVRPGGSHLAFQVRDLDRALEEVRRHGAELIGEITLFEESRCVYCREPSGTFFELEEVQPPDGVEAS